MSALWVMGLLAGLYFGITLVLGVLASRRSSSTPEAYFLAGRGLGTAVLFMALFGTNCTAFVLVGIPGLAFVLGLGVFGLNAAVVALVVPLTFWLIGSPARAMAQRLGALTPAELYAKRLDSGWVGAVMFIAFTAYTIPYMVSGVRGAELLLAQASAGALAPWAAGLLLLGAVLVYTSMGGMLGTAWTNVFQGALFMLFMILAFFFMGNSVGEHYGGGIGGAMRAVHASQPELLRIDRSVGLFQPKQWASWGLVISTTVIAFPHMFTRLLAAQSDAALRKVCRLYPLALVILWVPAVMIGVWGRVAFPELPLGESDRIFHMMASGHLPVCLGALAFLAVLAAVMSTLDAQILTLSSMLVRDCIGPFKNWGPRGSVRAGRLFTLVVALLVYGLARVWNDSIFEIARLSFEGYTTLVPTLFLGLHWRSFTGAGAISSIVVGTCVLLAGWTLGSDFPGGGFLPVFWAFIASTSTGVLVSLRTRAPGAERIAEAYGDGCDPGISLPSRGSS